MKKILVTGFSGFVSQHFINLLAHTEEYYSILGIDVNNPDFQFKNFSNVSIDFKRCNLLEKDNLERIIVDFGPDYILHLAAFSSVGFSWQSPDLCIKNNTDIFLNLIEILRKNNFKGRMLSVGSSEEYGNYSRELLPLKEDYVLHPVSPYAIARITQENLSKVYADGFGLDIIMTRSFNHIGPGQKDKFVIPSFAHQLVEIKKGIKTENKLITGNIEIIRDFLDVRDVVNAYLTLLNNGKKGEVYNICSGYGISLREIIKKMCILLDINVEIILDQKLVRPNDNMIIIGCNDKISKECKWKPKYNIDDSLMAILEYWSNIV